MALEHLQIKVLSDPSERPTFVAWINPQSYRVSYGITVDSQKPAGQKNGTTNVTSRSPSRINFKLILDTTGLIPDPLGSTTMPKNGVYDLIQSFIENIANPKESKCSQEPCLEQPRVRITWAQLQFTGILSSMSIDYKLFKPDGTPIRAELDLEFSESSENSNNTSTITPPAPNLIKQITVVEGDTLPGLCSQVYGNAKYYILVAQFNGLFDFRTLVAGTVLGFPPISSVGL